MYAKDAIWVEKYRPDTLDDIMGNENEVDRLKDWVDDPAMPNVMLYGPQGTGKTAAAVAFAKDKYGDAWNDHLLQLNASDDRGIDTVRKQIKGFASQGGVMGGHGFNIIMLDEVDHMTRQAQPAMRRVMEDFSDRTRFFLVCNYPNKLIDPIQSRCAPLNMSPLSDAQIMDLLKGVAENEELDYSENQLRIIVTNAEGDARSAIHTLQSATVDGTVTDDALDALIRLVDRQAVEEAVELAVNGDVKGAREQIDSLLQEGAGAQLLCNEFDAVISDLDMEADVQSLMIDKVADCEWRITHGTNPSLQFGALLADLRLARHTTLDNYRQAQEGN